MEQYEKEILEIVNRETKAWDTQDAGLLVSIFHPDMIWPWPGTNQSHDPMDWVFLMGRYDHDRWKDSWQQLFDTHILVHNKRQILKIELSAQGDGAFAVVDVDTLWENRVTGNRDHWKGRACKGYTRMRDGWKMIMHTGLLEYE